LHALELKFELYWVEKTFKSELKSDMKNILKDIEF
jgi:hypothetical protein